MFPSDDTASTARTDGQVLAGALPDVALSTSLRERLTEAAYPLFSRRGIRDVTLEEIERAAGVAAEHHGLVYASRDDAAVDFLARRERDWTIGTIEAGARERGATPQERLLAIFDVFDDWFQRDDFEACSFINVLIEMGAAHPLGQASIEYLVHIRQIVTTLAEEAGLRDPAEFARSWHILMKGSIISATEGDGKAARRAQAMARALISEHGGQREPVDGIGFEHRGLAHDETVADWTEWDDLLGRRGAVQADIVAVSATITPVPVPPGSGRPADFGDQLGYEFDLL
ncbi:TetR/AcrR family transcriptional regulator [Lacisediminihabitans sp. FW035]